MPNQIHYPTLITPIFHWHFMADLNWKDLEQDYRAHRYGMLWAKYRDVLIGACVAIVLATAGYEVWHYVSGKQREATYRAWAAAQDVLKHGDSKKASGLFVALSEEHPSQPLAVLSLLKAGNIAEDAGNKTDALNYYDAVVTHKNADPAVVTLARMRKNALSGESAPVAADQPLAYTANEVEAWGQYANSPTNTATALTAIEQDPDVPEAQKSRLTQLISFLAP